MIGILDVGIGNQGSICQAIYSLGYEPVSVFNPQQLDEITHLIIPGVGAYAHAMAQLKELGFVEPLLDFAASSRPLLGICLGMQLLADRGDEGGGSAGLGLISGNVSRLPLNSLFRVPHVGWNEVCFERMHPVFDGVRDGMDFYFVHSYHFLPLKETAKLANTHHGELIVCAVGERNVVGLQFHPEKSQKNGLQILENFCEWNGVC